MIHKDEEEGEVLMKGTERVAVGGEKGMEGDRRSWAE